MGNVIMKHGLVEIGVYSLDSLIMDDWFEAKPIRDWLLTLASSNEGVKLMGTPSWFEFGHICDFVNKIGKLEGYGRLIDISWNCGNPYFVTEYQLSNAAYQILDWMDVLGCSNWRKHSR